MERLFPEFNQAQTRARVATVMAEQRNMAIALESFRVFEGRLPSDREFYDATRLTLGPVHDATFQRTLTSPVSHIAALPGDPFTSNRRFHYGYWNTGERWILRSVGPDGRPDLDLPRLAEHLPVDPDAPDWPPEIMAGFYDPTNGLESSGDIIKTGP